MSNDTPTYSEAVQRLETIVSTLERGGTVSYTHLTLPTKRIV